MKGSLLILFILFFNYVGAQSFGIGTDTPDPQSILEIQSVDRGILIPRMTTTQRDNNITGLLNTSDEGLFIYNITDTGFNYWDGTAWVVFPSSSVVSDHDWYTALTTTSPTAIGDNIFTNGNVGIGNNNPTYALDVTGNGIRIEGGGSGHNIYGGTSGSIFLRTNSGLAVDLEEDGGSTGYFRVRNNADQNVFRVDHSGLTTIDGDLVIEDTDGNQIRFEGPSGTNDILADNELDIESEGSIDMVIDNDMSTTTGAAFRIKRNDDNTSAVNTLMSVPEDHTPLVYPYGTGTGTTGGIRFRELASNGISYIRLRAPDAISSSVNLTLPNTDGGVGEVLTTDGSGILSWSNAGASDADWFEISGVNVPNDINDDVYTLGSASIGSSSNAGPTNGLRVTGNVRIGYTGNAPANNPAVGSNAKVQIRATTNGDNGLFVHAEGSVASSRGPTGITSISDNYLGVFGVSYNSGTNGYVSAGGYFAGIGTDADRVGVVGTTEVNGSSVPVYINSGIKNGVAGHSDGSGIGIYANNTNISGWALVSDGDFDLRGDGYLNGVFWVASDKNIKSNVKSINDGLDVVKKLRPVSYAYTNSIAASMQNRFGFIAQEVRAVVPELTNKMLKENHSEAELYMDYTGIIPFLTKATQELDDKVIELEKENIRLKERIEKLEHLIKEK